MKINNIHNKYVILSDVKTTITDYKYWFAAIFISLIIIIAQNSPINEVNTINLNTCTYEEFILLDGIGEIKAERFINIRDEIENFNSTTDLLRYDIIGLDTYDNIKDLIRVD